MRCTNICLLAAALFSPAAFCFGAKDASPSTQPAIDISGFHDSIHHWRAIKDESRFIQALPDQPSYQPTQVTEIAANILLFQRENGGWPKDYDMTAILTDEQRAKVLATRKETDTSFDNGN